MKLFCDRLNIECMVVICGEDPEHGNPYRHAWNILKIQGVYYHLDVTFDLTLSRYGAFRFDYFNLDDKQMFKDHRPLIYPAPACTKGDVFYYKEEKGKSVTVSINVPQAVFLLSFHDDKRKLEIQKEQAEEN